MTDISTKTRTHAFKKRVLLLSGAAACLLAGATGALAQDQTSGLTTTKEKDSDGRTVVVVKARHFVPQAAMSANKTDISLIKTPQSVSVITRDQIDLLAFSDLQQAVRYTSGAFGENYGPDLRYDFITVRGFTPKQYVDGLAAPVTTTIFSTGLDLYAFDSVSILKGPASTLYGNVPPGGIYNETSRRASSTFGGELSAQAGSYDYDEVRGTVTGALTDNIAARFTGLYLDRDAERLGVKAKRTLLAPTATWTIDAETKLTGLAYYQHDEVDGDTNGFLPVYGTLLPNPNGQISTRTNLGEPDYNKYKRSQWGIGYDFTHAFASNIFFESNTKWTGYKEDSTDIYGGGGVDTTDYRTVYRYSFPYMENVNSFATDNRFDGTFATGAITQKVLVGVDYRDVKNFAQYGFASAPSIDLYDPVYSPASAFTTPPWLPYNNERLQQTGVYVQDQLNYQKLYVTLGGRYDTDKINDDNAGTQTSEDKFTYRVGANYVFDNGLAPYASYSTSFEPVIGTDSATGATYKPSEGTQTEAGLKYDGRTLGDGVHLFASAAVFDIQQKNVVTEGSSILPVYGTQAGEVEAKGFETEFVTRLNDQLSINGSYTYTDAKVTKDPNNPLDVGAALPTTPKNKVSLFADYTLKSGMAAGWGFGFGARYTSTSAGSLPGPYNTVVYWGQAATLFDAIIHYDTPTWRFAINGSNIFDKKYVARCASASGCTYGAGENVIATLTRKF